MKKQLVLITIILSVMNSFSQNWHESFQNGDNFYKIREEFNDYFKDRDKSKKGFGYKMFKRWEYFMEPRVYPSGDISLPSQTWKNYEEYLRTNPKQSAQGKSMMASTTWTALGPMGNLQGVADNGLPRKAGRINFITFHPAIANTFWVGAPAGGLWKTVNNGANWTTNTDNLPTIGCSDLAIDASNPNKMYLATGDGYNGNSRSSFCVGVYTTSTGGASWAASGLTFSPSQQVNMRRIIIHPTNPAILIAATNLGIYTSTNSAATWSLVSSANAFDLEFNAANGNTVYATGGTFSVSIDAGLTFSAVTNGIPGGGNRAAVAVTPANPNCVYVIKTNGNVLTGFYRSLNAGQSFSLMMNAPNILSSDCFTPGIDGQGTYDLGMASSPTNSNEVVVGGITVWKSLNAGAAGTWTNIGCGYGVGNPPFLHADQHEMEYTSAGVLYNVNDGGVSWYNGTQWNDINGAMNIAQIWKMGSSSISPNLFITGHQDNGSNIYNNGNYNASLMADGMDCFIDRTNDQNIFASKNSGDFYYSTNGGLAWQTCTAGAPGPGSFISPWKQDPVNPTVFYAGHTQMKKSTFGVPPVWFSPQGSMTPVVAGQYVTEFAISPANNQKIYALHGTSGVFTSTNGGTSWTQNNGGLPGGFWGTFMTAHPTNSLVAWLTVSGYSAGSKVYKTVNGGTTWTPMTVLGLPNLPVNCSVYEIGNVNDRIYIGMDVGVYYIDNVSASWTAYNNGLPNTPISDLEISPASPVKLRAATYGRGVYQVDIVPSNSPPVTAFNFAGTTCSVTSTVLFNDNSTNSPTSWSWSISPIAGVVINLPSSQNPTITFANYGTYTVSMIATNGFGVGSLNTQTISIAPPLVTANSSTPSVCAGETVNLTGTGANTFTWQPGNMIGVVVNYTPIVTQTYTMSGTTLNGCVGSNTITIPVILCPVGIISSASQEINFVVFPNPAHDKLNIMMEVNSETSFSFELIDITGRTVIVQNMIFSNNKNQQQLDISTLSKGNYFLKIISKDAVSKPVKIIKD